MVNIIMTPYELRYRDPDIKQPINIPTNEFTEGILTRKSIRRFDSTRKLPPGLLEYLICVAQSSPTGSHAQSWSVVALETLEEKENFRSTLGWALDGTDASNLFAFNECSVFLIWVADNYKIATGIEMIANNEVPESIEILNQLRNSDFNTKIGGAINRVSTEFEFDSSKHMEWLDQTNYNMRAVLDTAIAAQTFSLAAESLGLGTLYMGSISHGNITAFKESINLPNRTNPLFGMCIGYEPKNGTDYQGQLTPGFCKEGVSEIFKDNPQFSIKPRQHLDLVLHRGKYNKNIRPLLSRYNKIFMEYYVSVGINLDYIQDYLVRKCLQRVTKTVDILQFMKDMGNKWK